MKLEISNIGKVEDASILINGLTVIAGENNTGKSTLGKSLYAIFTSLYDYENETQRQKQNAIIQVIRAFIFSNYGTHLSMRVIRDIQNSDIELMFLLDKLIENVEKNSNNLEEVMNDLQIILECFIDKGLSIDIYELEESGGLEFIAKEVVRVLSIPNETVQRKLFNNIFRQEFSGQINRFGTTNSYIRIRIQKNTLEFNIKDDVVSECNNLMPLITDVAYIDNPYILDFSERIISSMSFLESTGYLLHHQHDLIRKLKKQADINVIKEIDIENRLHSIFEKINEVTNKGKLTVSERNKIMYEHKNNKLRLGNLSSGLKTFIILQTLLLNDSIKENGIIILDEPEVHLHPKWQLILAEIIVLIQKEFNLHILLTTHSPYFLYALEMFTQKHKIEKDTNYYLAENLNNTTAFKDVTDQLELIYQKLSAPLEYLEELEYGGEDADEGY